jgi:hypothetical protein
MVHLCETGGRPAGFQLPTDLAGLRFESIHVTTTLRSTAAIGGNEDQVLIDERIAMKAARAAVKPRVIRPDFFSCVLIQRIELAGAGSDEEQLSTDRGLGEDSAAGFNLP